MAYLDEWGTDEERQANSRAIKNAWKKNDEEQHKTNVKKLNEEIHRKRCTTMCEARKIAKELGLRIKENNDE